MSTRPVKKALSSHHKHLRKGLRLRIAAAALTVSSLVSVVFLWLAIMQTPDTHAAIAVLRKSVAIDTVGSQTGTITSKYGFVASFNTQTLDADAKVIKSATNADVYTGNDVYTPRSYAVVDLVVKKGVIDTNGVGLSFPPSLAILTNANKDFFERQRAKTPGNPSDEQLVINHYAPQPASGNTAKLIQQEPEQVGTVTYQKLTYQITRDNYPSAPETELQYITVQNGRPYALVVDYFAGTQQGDLVPLFNVIAGIQYRQPSADAEYVGGVDAPASVAKTNHSYILASATLNEPSALASDTALTIVAKNQLAVVRVGSISCYDLALASPDGSTAMQAKDACTAIVGSGSIIAKDGYIATNGHVVAGTAQEALQLYLQLALKDGDTTPLSQYLAYLKAARLITEAESRTMLAQVPAGDQTAMKALMATFAELPASAITTSNESHSYAVQLSDDPIKVTFDHTHISFKKTQTVVPASLVDQNYSGKIRLEEASAASDVALLKLAKSQTYPTVALGSIDTVHPNDQITVVGFPGYVDGGLQTSQTHTVPTATQGSATEKLQLGSYRLLETSVPVAQGNSGGPAFGDAGTQIGIATYSKVSADDRAAGVTKLSKSSYLRDIADIKALANKNHIVPSASPVSDDWHAGVDAFGAGNYREALRNFQKVQAAYGDNYLVTILTNQAQSQVDDALNPLILPAGLVATSLLLLGVVIFGLVRHGKQAPPPTPLPPMMSPQQ